MKSVLIFSYLCTEAINHAAEAWGLKCMRYEIKDIQLPTKVREAMQMQVRGKSYVDHQLMTYIIYNVLIRLKLKDRKELIY